MIDKRYRYCSREEIEKELDVCYFHPDLIGCMPSFTIKSSVRKALRYIGLADKIIFRNYTFYKKQIRNLTDEKLTPEVVDDAIKCLTFRYGEEYSRELAKVIFMLMLTDDDSFLKKLDNGFTEQDMREILLYFRKEAKIVFFKEVYEVR